MSTKTGVCVNFGNCDAADSKKRVTVLDGLDFECPECKGKLSVVETGGSNIGLNPKGLKIALPLIGLLLFAAFYFTKSKGPSDPTGESKQVASRDKKTTPVSDACSGSIQKDVMANIMRRGYMIIGVQYSAPPMNDSPDSEDGWTRATSGGAAGEEERRRRELNWKRGGFDYEMANLIAAQMGLVGKTKVKAREVKKFEDLFCLLNRQESNGDFSVDFAMSGIAIDPAYDGTISWSKGYVDFGYSLIAKKSSYIESLGQLNGKNVGLVQGDNVVDAYVKQNVHGANVVPLSDQEDSWLNNALNLGKIDAVIYDYPFAAQEVREINKQKGKEGIVGQLLEIKLASLPDSEHKYSIAVPKGNDDLLEKINEAIDRVKNTPQYGALVRRYFTSRDVKPPTIAAGVSFAVVRNGDSLTKIAERELHDMHRWVEIAKLNNVGNVYLIFPDQRLAMPPDYKN